MTQYLSPAEVAEALGISLRQVRRHVASGELAASRIGSSHLLRIRSEDVDALYKPLCQAWFRMRRSAASRSRCQPRNVLPRRDAGRPSDE